MPVRSGSFQTTLNPFGYGGSSLGKYSLGQTASEKEQTELDLADAEAYTAQIAWSNGVISNSEYLAALQRLINATTAGTKERTQAENRLWDAQYSIGRAEVAAQVNLASSTDAKIAAYRSLISFEQSWLSKMAPGNPKALDIQERIAQANADIRSVTYARLVRLYNDGRTTTDALVAVASRLAAESTGQQDHEDWQQVLVELAERKHSEYLADLSHKREMGEITNREWLAALEAEVKRFAPGTPKYNEALRDLEEQAAVVADQERVDQDQRVQRRFELGEISQETFLRFLAKRAAESEPGSSEKQAYEEKLVDWTFSLTEDKLRSEYEDGKRPLTALRSFYTAAIVGLNPGSKRYRDLMDMIQWCDEEAKRGKKKSASGGGGSSSVGDVGALDRAPGVNPVPLKVLDAADMTTLAGQAGAPKDLSLLLNPDAIARDWAKKSSQTTSLRGWFDANYRALKDGEDLGQWTFIDRNGNLHVLPYTKAMEVEMSRLNSQMAFLAIGYAPSNSKRNTAFGEYLSAVDGEMALVTDMTMDSASQAWETIKEQREILLAQGRYGEAANLGRVQYTFLRSLLGLDVPQAYGGKADVVPLEIDNGRNAAIAADAGARSTVAGWIDEVQIWDPDPASPTYNPGGDRLAGLIAQGYLTVTVGPDGFENVQMDPTKAITVQTTDAYGVPRYSIVTAWDVGTETVVNEAGQPEERPTYLSDYLHVVFQEGDRTVDAWVPRRSSQGARDGVPVYVKDMPGYTPAQIGMIQQLSGSSVSGGTWQYVGNVGTGIQYADILRTSPDGSRQKYRMWSVDGVTWVEQPIGTGGGPGAPRVVLSQDAGATVVGGTLLVNGKPYDPAVNGEITKYLHFYNQGDYLRDRGETQDPQKARVADQWEQDEAMADNPFIAYRTVTVEGGVNNVNSRVDTRDWAIRAAEMQAAATQAEMIQIPRWKEQYARNKRSRAFGEDVYARDDVLLGTEPSTPAEVAARAITARAAGMIAQARSGGLASMIGLGRSNPEAPVLSPPAQVPGAREGVGILNAWRSSPIELTPTARPAPIKAVSFKEVAVAMPEQAKIKLGISSPRTLSSKTKGAPTTKKKAPVTAKKATTTATKKVPLSSGSGKMVSTPKPKTGLKAPTTTRVAS